ncbi:MAG: hypothetical protein AB8H79_14395, partial [Myxococcota bacterium]
MRSAILALCVLSACTSGQEDDVRVVPDTDSDIVYVGVMEVTPADELVISDAVVGERKNGVVRVRNTGDFPLVLKSAVMSEDAGGALVTDEPTNSGRTLEAGETFEVLVVCTLPSSEGVQGTLRVESGDE